MDDRRKKGKKENDFLKINQTKKFLNLPISVSVKEKEGHLIAHEIKITALMGTSRVVQWFKSLPFHAGGMVLIPGWGNKIPHADQLSQHAASRESPHTPMKTQDSQNNHNNNNYCYLGHCYCWEDCYSLMKQRFWGQYH